MSKSNENLDMMDMYKKTMMQYKAMLAAQGMDSLDGSSSISMSKSK